MGAGEFIWVWWGADAPGEQENELIRDTDGRSGHALTLQCMVRGS